MAEFLYDTARNAFATKQWDWAVDGFSGYLVDNTYSAEPGHGFSSLSAAVVAGPLALAGKSVTSEGWCIVNDLLFPNLPASSAQIAALVLRHDASGGLCYFSNELAGLPFVSTGGTYAVRFVSTPAFFRL